MYIRAPVGVLKVTFLSFLLRVTLRYITLNFHRMMPHVSESGALSFVSFLSCLFFSL